MSKGRKAPFRPKPEAACVDKRITQAHSTDPLGSDNSESPPGALAKVFGWQRSFSAKPNAGVGCALRGCQSVVQAKKHSNNAPRSRQFKTGAIFKAGRLPDWYCRSPF